MAIFNSDISPTLGWTPTLVRVDLFKSVRRLSPIILCSLPWVMLIKDPLTAACQSNDSGVPQKIEAYLGNFQPSLIANSKPSDDLFSDDRNLSDRSSNNDTSDDRNSSDRDSADHKFNMRISHDGIPDDRYHANPISSGQSRDQFADTHRLEQFDRPAPSPLQPIGDEVQTASFQQQADQPFTPRRMEPDDRSHRSFNSNPQAENVSDFKNSFSRAPLANSSDAPSSLPQQGQPSSPRWENQQPDPGQNLPNPNDGRFNPGVHPNPNGRDRSAGSLPRNSIGIESKLERELDRESIREFNRESNPNHNPSLSSDSPQQGRQSEIQTPTVDRLAAARQHAEQYRSRFNNTTIEGTELSLVDCLARSSSTQQRPQLVAQYWETWKLAADVIRIQQQFDWLQQITDVRHDQDAMLLQAAKSQLENRLLATQIDLLEGQQRLSRFLRRSVDSPSNVRSELPQPIDSPLIKKYTTHYQLYRNRGQMLDRFEHIDDQLGQTLVLIERQTDTVKWAKQAADSFRSNYQRGENGLSNVLEAARLLNSAEQSWLRYVTNYNRMIADYSLSITDGSHPPETIVAMLIDPRGNEIPQSGVTANQILMADANLNAGIATGQAWGRQPPREAVGQRKGTFSPINQSSSHSHSGFNNGPNSRSSFPIQR